MSPTASNKLPPASNPGTTQTWAQSVCFLLLALSCVFLRQNAVLCGNNLTPLACCSQGVCVPKDNCCVAVTPSCCKRLWCVTLVMLWCDCEVCMCEWWRCLKLIEWPVSNMCPCASSGPLAAWVGWLWAGVQWKSGCFGKDNTFLQAIQECGTGLSLKRIKFYI